LKTNGTVAWTPFGVPSGSSCEEAFLTAPGGNAALCIDLDTSAEQQGAVWASIGFRGGAVRVFDCQVRKLARKIENVDPLGVHSITFCGPENALRGHRGFLLAATFSGNVSLLSIEQGAILSTVQGPHSGAFITSIARCMLPRADASCEPMSGVSTPAASADEEEVFVTCGDNGTLLRWCTSVNNKQLVTSIEPYPRCDTTTAAAGSHTSKHTAWRLESIHTCLAEEFPIAVTGLLRQTRSSWRERGADWIAVATKGGFVAVHSMSLNVALLICRLDKPAISLALGVRSNSFGSALHDSTLDKDSALQHSDDISARNILVVAASDGVLHGFDFHAVNNISDSHSTRKAVLRKKSVVVRTEADTQSTAIVEDVGGAVEGLILSIAPMTMANAPLLCAVSPVLKRQFAA
jgi:hypothetical protein